MCARFEEAWGAERPGLAAFLAEVPEGERSVLFAELLHIDLECRRRAGELPAIDDYLPLFPSREGLLREVFAGSMPDTGDPLQSEETPALPAPEGPGGVRAPGYEILEEIGRGGMGVVYKARHLALKRLVALKYILAGRLAHSRHRERFDREALAVARLRHPNIIQIYEIGESDGHAFIALELGDAGNLRDRLAGTPMNPRSAAGLMEPIARAVQHAHRQGVVHRDIKPANVVLAQGGDSIMPGHRPLPEFHDKTDSGQLPVAYCTPKLTDFGLARLLGDEGPLTEFGVAAGTPSYMAPEQATGAAEPGPAADVWALGATLYECLTGRPPFKAATAVETLRQVAEADPVPPSQLNAAVPRDLETICLKCLAKEPGQRYEGARELAQDLQRFLAGEPILARPASAWERAWRWAKRRPGTAALVGLLVASILAGAIGIAWAMLYAFAGWNEAERNEKQARAAEGDARKAEDEAKKQAR
ncbi:MAG: serine/threonine protein kinase, partial [Gemmataceae bacterium]|nr:serine/threonine protein kinase [Gemmataceae bacterium]